MEAGRRAVGRWGGIAMILIGDYGTQGLPQRWLREGVTFGHILKGNPIEFHSQLDLKCERNLVVKGDSKVAGRMELP